MRALLLLSLTFAWAGPLRAQEEAEPIPSPVVRDEAPLSDHVESEGALAEALARLPQQEDPQRHLARSFVTLIHAMLEGDLEQLLKHFHPELRFHTGGGAVEPMPPETLRRVFEGQLAQRDPTPRTVGELVTLEKVKVYSYARARAVDPAEEGWETQLGRVGKLMQEDDWLVIAPMKGGEWGDEVFFVFRRDSADPSGRFKVVLSD